MKILLHDYAGHPFQVQLSRQLARLGHTVLHAFAGQLQTPRGELALHPDDPAGFGLTEVRMDRDYRKYKYSFLRRRSMEIAYGQEAARLLESWQPDAVVSANTPTEAQGAILAKARERGCRFVSWVQDIYSVAVSEILRKKLPVAGHLAGSWYRRLDRSQLEQSHHIVAIAEDFKTLIVNDFHIPREKISVIPNWAPIESLPQLPKSNPWAKAQGLDDRFCFLYSGTLGMKHNPALLLQLAIQFKNDPAVRVVVVSEGIGADWLAGEKRRHALENLVLLPYQPFEEMPQVLAAGDVLMGILETSAGKFSVPSKVLTYLCAGRPLLLAVPAANLAARITSEAAAGLCVPPDDTAGFLSAAESLRKNPENRQELAKNARQYAEKAFKINEIAVKFEEIIKN